MKTHCATCGTPLLKGGALDELCGACLFEASRRPPAADLPDRIEQEEVARLFPDLEILEPLGVGGMGVVWRARQKRLDREVALKLLRPELAEQPGFAQRFQREARALAKLSHANVVVVHDFGEVRGRFYLLMEYVQGVGLRDLIRDGRLTPARVLEIVPEICAGLQYAHENGVIHRDIKPENILVDGQGHVRIADFGLAKMLGQEEVGLTRTSQVMGTYEYMSPEQIYQPLGVDHRADVYSLGVVLYEMLTGDLPRGRFASPSEKVPVDSRFDDVVAKALQEEREARYQSVGAVQSDVEEIARDSKLEHKPKLSPPRESPELPRRERVEVVEAGEFERNGKLDWIAGLGANPQVLLTLSLVSTGLIFLTLIYSARSYNRVRFELFALAYPPAWLALTLLRTKVTGITSQVILLPAFIFALTVGWSALVLTCCGTSGAKSIVETLPYYLACGILMLAHLILERGLRRSDWVNLGLAPVLVFLAALVFSTSPYKSGANALGFFLGMSAILLGTSLCIWLPSAMMERPGQQQRRAIISCTVAGLLFAFLYFAPLL